jgi:hypothetical protein
MNKKERTARKAWIKEQGGQTMTPEEWAKVQGMTHSEFNNPSKIKDFYADVDKKIKERKKC